MTSNASDSPCINVCKLDDSGMCVGCGRLLGEVAAWSKMTDQQRSAVRELATRRLSQSLQRIKMNYGQH